MSTTSDLSQKVTEHAADLSAQAQAKAKAEATARASEVKHAAADQVQNVADAAHAAASEFDHNAPQAQAVNQVADHIQDFAEKLRTADVQHLAAQATDFARRNPMLSIGGAALVGFAAARFLKARDPNRMTGTVVRDPWAQGRDYDSAPPATTGGQTHG